MALRSRISTVRAPDPDVDAATPEAAQHEEAEQPEAPPRRIFNPARGAVAEPASEHVVEDIAPETRVTVKTRKPRGPNKAKPEKVSGMKTSAAEVESAPQLRAKLKELEAEIKTVRTKHLAELNELRTAHLALNSKLFDLTK